MLKVRPVILCGGSGTRLWPLSRTSFPKQFLTLAGNRSLFQKTVEITSSLCGDDITADSTIVVTNEEHRFLVSEQLREIGRARVSVLLEPFARNTAPALTIAAMEATALGDDPILVVMPADQAVDDIKNYKLVLQQSIRLAATDVVVILGVKPTHPETGYGYIRCDEIQESCANFNVAEFVEKPDLTRAKQYVGDPHFFWNAGVFVLKASLWLKMLNEYREDIAHATVKAWNRREIDGIFIRPNEEDFSLIPSESIDYAVVEKSAQSKKIIIKMIPLDVGWSDLGTWNAVSQIGKVDTDGNVVNGDVILKKCTNTFVHSESRLVAAVGLSDIVVVETADAILVINKNFSQDVKQVVSDLDKLARSEIKLHRKVHRPWGWYDSIEEGSRFKVKRIHVNSGASISLQKHQYRAEHWIVVKGIAEVVNGGEVLVLNENQSTYIPPGVVHRLTNKGCEPLQIIEVQSGEYLGEDDIVRLDDSYGRK